jgi:hypothetical protein
MIHTATVGRFLSFMLMWLGAYLIAKQTLRDIVALLPDMVIEAYGKKTFCPLLFFVALGIFALLRAKKYSILALCLAWGIPLIIYFLTFFRAGYLRMLFLPFLCWLVLGFKN